MNRGVERVLRRVRDHPLLREVAQVAAERDLLPVYLVGGCVRNALLKGPEGLDIDLVSPAPASLGAALQDAFAGRLIGFAEGVHRVVFSRRGKRVQVDIAPLRGGSIVEDLRRRDFTINALGISLGEDPTDLIDPTGGLRDLRARRIRVGDPQVLAEDPLRLLRTGCSTRVRHRRNHGAGDPPACSLPRACRTGAASGRAFWDFQLFRRWPLADRHG